VGRDDAATVRFYYWQRQVAVWFPPATPDLLQTARDYDATYEQRVATLAQELNSLSSDGSARAKAFRALLVGAVQEALVEHLTGIAALRTLREHLVTSIATLTSQYAAPQVVLVLLVIGGSLGHIPLQRKQERPTAIDALAQEYLRFSIEQNTYTWYAIRVFLIGGSALDHIFGTNNYELAYRQVTPEQQAVLQYERHLGVQPGKDFSKIPHFLRNGHTFEALGRDLCAKLIQETVVEHGVGISPYNATYNHSPDGGMIGNQSGSGFKAMIEVKCHSGRMSSSYETIPDIYIPQCLQGMIIHNVPVCYFVSLFYRPVPGAGRSATITIEKLYRTDERPSEQQMLDGADW